MDTFLLDQKTWDLTTDLSGNWALASNPYSQAQDAASAMRLFQGELWYNTARGIPYWQQVLGRYPPLSYVRSLLAQIALTVPGIVRVRVFISAFKNRKISGQVQIFTSARQTSTVAF